MSCPTCQQIDCVNASDTDAYSLQSGRTYFSAHYSIAAPCPDGRICGPEYPVIVDIPESTFEIVVCPAQDSKYILRLDCCQSDISKIVPSTLSDSEMQAVVDDLMLQCATQEAACRAEEQYPTIPKLYGNQPVYFQLGCDSPNVPALIGTIPTGVSLDSVNRRVVLAAGTIKDESQALSNAAAQIYLDSFCNDAMVRGNLQCNSVPPVLTFSNNLFFINCFGGTLTFDGGNACSGGQPATYPNGYTFTIQRTFIGGISFNATLTATYHGPSMTLYYKFSRTNPIVQDGTAPSILSINGTPVVSLDVFLTATNETHPFNVNDGDVLTILLGCSVDPLHSEVYTETVFIDSNP